MGFKGPDKQYASIFTILHCSQIRGPTTRSGVCQSRAHTPKPTKEFLSSGRCRGTRLISAGTDSPGLQPLTGWRCWDTHRFSTVLGHTANRDTTGLRAQAAPEPTPPLDGEQAAPTSASWGPAACKAQPPLLSPTALAQSFAKRPVFYLDK